MTLLLTQNDWCVGAGGTGVAIPCCSSWFQCHKPWQRLNTGVSVTLLYSGVIFLELF